MSSTPSTTSSPPRPVKKENEEEIKEFAETAMNELLGWYGYERLELRRWAASRSRTKDASSPDQVNEHKDKEECSWCNKSLVGCDSGALQQAGATFCSELCFSQSRRANFKRAKTCDWCRHVRHTVAYVDFQDGATQLQFCSDKCLNQYKMHIFCRETQAHLDLHPHLAPPASATPASLITPDLWLRNCRSRSVSPRSDRTPSPDALKGTDKTPTEPKKSPLPLITIAPTAKLMKPKRTSEERTQTQKSPESKRNGKLNLRKRRTSKCSATVTSQTARHSSTPKAQDLRMCSPNRLDGPSPVSTIGSGALHSPTHPVNPMPPPFPNPLFGMPAPVFMDHPHGLLNDQRLPMFPPRPSYLPRGMPMPQERPRLPLPLNFPQHLGQTPPVTILVPYPVPVPIPLPIPIPMPMSAFLRAHLSGIHKVKTEAKSEDNEGPLDFTMNGDKNKDEDANHAQDLKTHEVNDPVPETFNEGNERVEPEDKSEASELNVETGNPEQTLPKFKITRLGNKMAKIITKPREQPESTRPLRKRRRLVEVSTDDDPLIPKTRKIVQV